MAPDVFVVLGANSADRCTYLLWEEPKAPDFVLEVTSCSTRHEDQVIKRDLYRSLGVREYFLFDPTNDYLKPPLQGLELRVTERGLRFHDPHAGEDLPNYAETAQWRERPARLEAKSLLAQETAARKAAEARVAELEARLRQAGGDDPAGGQPGSTCRVPGRRSVAVALPGGRSATGSFESATCWGRRR